MGEPDARDRQAGLASNRVRLTDPAIPPGTVRAAAPNRRHASTSVLVVDDRAADREPLTTVLGSARYAVSEAASGMLAIELARSQRPDLIIAGILLPDMDGYELVRELGNQPVTADIPVIFHTATYLLEEVGRLAAACGVSRLLAKPCEPEEIIGAVEEAVSSPPKPRAVLTSEQFHREHLRVLNAKLRQKIDELHDAQRQATESLMLLEAIESSAPVGFGFLDREHRLCRVNDVLAAVGGASVEDLLGREVADVVPKLWAQLEAAYEQVLATGEPVVNQEVHAASSAAPGENRAWLANYYPVRIEGDLSGVGVVVVDITDRLAAEEFRSVVIDNMAEGLFALDGEGQLTYLNAAASRMLGWSEDELRGKPMHDAVHFQHGDGSVYPAEECELLKVGLENRAIRVADDAFTRKDGSIFPTAYSAAPLGSATDQPGVVVVFHDTSDEKARETRAQRELNALSWVGRIREALDDDRMILYSQPIIPLTTRANRSEELLVRMVGRDGKIIAPGAFLPVAEKYGQIAEIDEWVIKQAARVAARGQRIHANLSADSVGNVNLLSRIGRELSDAGADPANIVFEITETALMSDTQAGEAFTRGITDIGSSVALDDFGTGYASFTYLQKLHIGYIKIDIEFVRDLVSNTTNQHLVKAIVNIAHGLGQQTIAEGVENRQTFDLLRDYGVDLAQGFHLGRPRPLHSEA
jgi:PAS domain S-box-containing protein